MGLSHTDGRLIRPADEPTTAQVAFDWTAVHSEGLTRRVEVRKQKWAIKQRELELIAARNHLLPRLDAFGTYRWVGGGDKLFGDDQGGATPFSPGVGAFNVLTDGNFQEWEMGMRFSVPIGFRQQMSMVRHHQLLLARERALLQDLELEVSHQLGDAIRDLDLNYSLTETNFNRRAAAQREVEAVETSYKANRVTLDLLLDAQRRRSDAETAYYRSLVDFNLAITDVHYRKGSLLDYNGVYLAEGPWPGKAYFDAMRRARQRDASLYLDYGYTRPNVMSRGPHAQQTDGANGVYGEGTIDGVPVDQMVPEMAVPNSGEYLEPVPAEPTGTAPKGTVPMSAITPGARSSLFAAPGDQAVVAGMATGYETTPHVGFQPQPNGQPQPITAPRGKILMATAEADGTSPGVIQAYGAAPETHERQAHYTADRPPAETPVGAGGGR
jgi:hypothetical protein